MTVPCNNSHRVWGVTPNLAKSICESLVVFIYFFFWSIFWTSSRIRSDKGTSQGVFFGGGGGGGDVSAGVMGMHGQ